MIMITAVMVFGVPVLMLFLTGQSKQKQQQLQETNSVASNVAENEKVTSADKVETLTFRLEPRFSATPKK